MEIIVHLGAHRSASTLAQGALRRHAVPLAEAGVQLWTPSDRVDGLVAPLSLTPGARAVRMFEMRRRGARRLVVSEENLIGSVWGNLAAAKLYPDAQERLLRLRSKLGPVDRLALCIRRYDSYWTSALAYGLTRGAPRPDPARLAAQPLRWRHLIRTMGDVFPEAERIVWLYEERGATPPLDLLTGQVVPIPEQRVNKGPKTRRLARALGHGVPPGWPFDKDQRAALAIAYHADLRWLRETPQVRLIGPACTNGGVQDRSDLTVTPIGRRNAQTTGGIAHVRHQTVD